ncbi:MAG: hypothetical protein KC589_00565 [Nanoarchaeota archaeon]|nr:hypothetical protein [Nanoarchaeota archaeon]
MSEYRKPSDYDLRDFTILSQLTEEKLAYQIQIKRQKFFDFIFPCDFLFNRSFMFKLCCLLKEYHDEGLVDKIQYFDESLMDYYGKPEVYYTYVLSKKGNKFINSNKYSICKIYDNRNLIPINI